MHLHILGICGTFMGGVAQLAKSLGFKVSGCDSGVYPPMSDQLRKAGIEVIEGFDPSQMELNPDLYIIGNAITRGNPLLEALFNARKPYTSGPQWLSENVLQGKKVLAVAGTHGKTTTSSMLMWILKECDLNPGYLIGGVPQGSGKSAEYSPSEWFVIEADEYDTALFDKRSKFVHYRPWIAILNNLEYDHADIFPNVAAIQTQFHHLVRIIPSHGTVIWNGESQTLKEVIEKGCWSTQQTFGGQETDDWRLSEYEGTRVFLKDTEIGRLELPLPGRHNRLNALAAIAAACAAGVAPLQALDALSTFGGVKRRLELKGEVRGVKVIDDFAHHPTAIEETLKAQRSVQKSGRILAVLEPRSNTMKLGSMKDRLPTSLSEADKVFCFQSPAVQWDIAQALTSLGEKVSVFTDLDKLVAAVVANATSGDTVLVMSNGGFGGVHEKILKALELKE
ncbi:MAG: UDP-N-acetylmuramate:L-alanyl-gamma-D-glutamyl-meso-diaminopimelate ligase [Burkholderiales bacterium]|nr:UDP-N-acetylmuramate:L-alanyl-gamma-D-glutamyl-meso-diaminopimelate ligase [Burkholderiales bacterium]